MIVRNSLSACPPITGTERGHRPCCLQRGIWHCRWQSVPPGETSDSPLACRSRDPAGQRSAELLPPSGGKPTTTRSREQSSVAAAGTPGTVASSASNDQGEGKPTKQAPSLGRPDTGRLAVSRACRSMQGKLMAPRCPARRRAQRPPGHATSDQRYIQYTLCDCILRTSSPLVASPYPPAAKLRPNAGDIIPKRGLAPQT